MRSSIRVASHCSTVATCGAGKSATDRWVSRKEWVWDGRSGPAGKANPDSALTNCWPGLWQVAGGGHHDGERSRWRPSGHRSELFWGSRHWPLCLGLVRRKRQPASDPVLVGAAAARMVTRASCLSRSAGRGRRGGGARRYISRDLGSTTASTTTSKQPACVRQ